MYQNPSPTLHSTDDGLVRAMSTKYAAERASAQNTPAALRSADGQPRAKLGGASPPAHAHQTPSGRRQHNPYGSSDALRALPDEPSVAASALLPSAGAQAPEGLRARRDPPPAAPVSAFSQGGYQVPRMGAAPVSHDAPAISDSDDEDGHHGHRSHPPSGGGNAAFAKLSPGAVYRPAAHGSGPLRSQASPTMRAAPQQHQQAAPPYAQVRRTPGARAMPDAHGGPPTPGFASGGGYADPARTQLPPAPPPHNASPHSHHGSMPSVQRQATPDFRASSEQYPQHHQGSTHAAQRQATPDFRASEQHPPQHQGSTHSTQHQGSAHSVQRQATPDFRSTEQHPPQHFSGHAPQQQQAPPPPPAGGTGHAGQRSPPAGDAPLPFTSKDMQRILQVAIASNNQAETPDAPPCADVSCPPGLSLTVYNGDISQHFNIPSENVQITRGAIKYVDHHARYGAQ
eukprot:CAMPEP_0174850938 /NCGR_PEP_ID=MMETSP1114-20130205/21217_1 /TAXON_ID=312471 /ORGANISM="Neobodo designis, Strain CCAP 1951/1" /LENGTH=455 /DNA_ID=CAMNT_0016085429 /DNA_START=207 /DNA_END=1571 /DNA_ORIENTATION=+